MLGLNEFDFRAVWSPDVMFIISAIAVLYLLAVGSYRTRWFKQSTQVSTSKKIAMITGLALYYFAHGGPLDLLAHLMFSAHMLSMAISYLIVPPLLIYGLPDWMLRKALGTPKSSGFFHKLMTPIFSLLLFNIVFSLYHWPDVLEYVMTHYIVHDALDLFLLFAALMMWWHVISPLPEYERLTDVKKMGYVFANGVLLTPSCALIIFADSAVYSIYTDPAIWAKALGYCVPIGSEILLSTFGGPEAFAYISPLGDQQLGGIIMKLTQEIMYGAILFYIFLRWFRRENPSDKIDPVLQS